MVMGPLDLQFFATLILYSLLFAGCFYGGGAWAYRPFGNSYLNFLSSHDGFGMRPTEGLLDEAQRQRLDRLEANGSLFSRRARCRWNDKRL